MTLVLRRGTDAGELPVRPVAGPSFGEADLLDAAACLAARHHALRGDEYRLRSWLTLLAQAKDLARRLGGEPRRVLDRFEQTVMAQARLQGEAIQTIWREPMLEARDAAVALGAKGTNREKVRRYRVRSWLLGLASGRGDLYPAFQFDSGRRDVFADVRAVNERLEAVGDTRLGAMGRWSDMAIASGARELRLRLLRGPLPGRMLRGSDRRSTGSAGRPEPRCRSRPALRRGDPGVLSRRAHVIVLLAERAALPPWTIGNRLPASGYRPPATQVSS